MEPGEKLYLPAETVDEQKEVKKALAAAQSAMAATSPEVAMTVDISVTFMDKKLWVLMKKRATSRVVGFMVKDGVTKKVSLDVDEQKLRRVSLMVQDGYTLEEIEENEGRLTDAELTQFGLQREDGNET